MIGLGIALSLGAAARVAGDTPPDVPTGFAVTARTPTSLTVEWDALPDGVTACVNWGDGELNELTGTSQTITGLTTDAAYDLKVRAEGPGGNSEWSDVLTDEYTLPAIPTGLDAMTSGYKTVTLQWDTQSGVTFKLYRDGVEIWSGADHTFIDDTPDADESYQYRVRAVSIASELESEWTSVEIGTSGAGAAPSCSVPPAIEVGLNSLLTLTSSGTWSGDPAPGSPTYQWQYRVGGTFNDIVGEVLDTHLIGEGPGSYRCAVTRSNAVSSTTAYSSEFLYYP